MHRFLVFPPKLHLLLAESPRERKDKERSHLARTCRRV